MPCPCCSKNQAERGRSLHGSGTAKVSSAACPWSTLTGAAKWQRYAFWWCTPANWPTKRRWRMPPPKPRKPSGSPSISSVLKAAGWPVPPKAEAPQVEVRYRLLVHPEPLVPSEETHGWTVLATTLQPAVCTDTGILQAYQEQHTTVEPGFRWIKNPAAISPVWLEKPERIAALAMLTVVGLLVSSVIQRQVRLYLRTHDQQIPGNKGLTAAPTTAVVLALFAQVSMVQLGVADQQVEQMYGVQSYHLLLCDALGLDSSWYEVPSAQKNGRGFQTP